MPAATRRQALVAIAGAAAASTPAAAADYQPRAFSPADFELLAALAETILPRTDTPGAIDAGVPQMLDEDAAGSPVLRRRLDAALKPFRKDRFVRLGDGERVALMTSYMNDAGARGRAFQTMKDATVDRYYQTEAGLAQELGYQGATYLASFPGCQHPSGHPEKG